MSGYQEFAPGSGHSRSAAKLVALMLPRLAGLSVLDAGCAEGFFSGFAAARGASRVVGVDRNAASIASAAARFPGCEFVATDWADAPAGPFDVVLLLSALHYAVDQEAAIHGLMRRVSPGGVLILEAGLADGPADEWVRVERADGVISYPTRARLESALAGYAYKVVGRSVMQHGDPVTRWVVHIRRKLPMVLLLPGPSFTGKSTLARTMAEAGVPYRSIDTVLPSLMREPPPGALGIHLKELSMTLDPLVDAGRIVASVFSAGLGADLLSALVGPGRLPVCVVEGALPPGALPQARAALLAAGFAAWVGDSPFPNGAPALEDSGLSLVAVGGATAFLSDGAVDGRLDAISVEGSALRVSGWAVDTTGVPKAAAAFTVTVGGSPRPTGLRAVARVDLVEAGIVPAGVAAGFDLEAPLEAGDAAAIAAGAAVEVIAAAAGLRAGVIRTGRAV